MRPLATLFLDKKNVNLNAKISMNDLTDLVSCARMSKVGVGPTKGGCCDTYDERVSISQGGGNRTERLRVNGQADDTQRRIAGSQDQQCLAYQPGQIRGVEKPRAGSVGKTGSGKLNSSSVARRVSHRRSLRIGTSQAFSQAKPAVNATFMSYDSTRDDVIQRFATFRYHKQGGSVEGITFHMAITSITSPLAHDGQQSPEYVGVYISRDALSTLIARGLLDGTHAPYFTAPEQAQQAYPPYAQLYFDTLPQSLLARQGKFCPACMQQNLEDSQFAADWFEKDEIWQEALAAWDAEQEEVQNAAD